MDKFQGHFLKVMKKRTEMKIERLDCCRGFGLNIQCKHYKNINKEGEQGTRKKNMKEMQYSIEKMFSDLKNV